MASLPGAWHHRVSTGTGWSGVSKLWPDQAKFDLQLYLSVAAGIVNCLSRSVPEIHKQAAESLSKFQTTNPSKWSHKRLARKYSRDLEALVLDPERGLGRVHLHADIVIQTVLELDFHLCHLPHLGVGKCYIWVHQLKLWGRGGRSGNQNIGKVIFSPTFFFIIITEQ